MRRILIGIALAALAGCAPVPVATIRDSGDRQSFNVAGDYQANYRRLLDEMKRCMQSGMITATVVVHGDLYPDIRRGTIEPTTHGSLGADVLFVVDVVGESEGSTRVDVISKTAGSSNAKLLRGVFDGTPLCQR